MKTVRLTTAQAIVRYLIAQQTEIDGELRPLFPGVFAIFGHGNVTCLGPGARGGQRRPADVARPERAGDGARRRRLRQGHAAPPDHGRHVVDRAGRARTWSPPPRVAHANRLPVLLLSGDTFASRIPDPVLQQVEHFDDPSITVNDAFKPVTRYWDRIVEPEQVVHSLPHAVATMLDPATCGPAFLGLPAGRPGRGVRLPRPLLRADACTRSPGPRADAAPARPGGRRADPQRRSGR